MAKLQLTDALTHFGCILYPDAENYDCSALLNSWSDYFAEWAYVLHDKDTDADGNLKKPHYHVYGKHTTSALASTVVNKTGVPFSVLRKVPNRKGYIQYFLHFGEKNQDKFQYPFDTIQSNFDCAKYFSKLPDIIQAQMLYNFIYSGTCTCMKDLVDFALYNECWSELRRGSYIFRSLLSENKPSLENKRKE